MNHQQHNQNKPSCSKCGYNGHLTYQCRNFIPTQQNKEVVLDVSSTSSEDEGVTPLTQLRAAELKEKLEELKKKKKTKRSRKSSSSSSSTPPRKKKKEAKKKKKKEKKKKEKKERK